MRLLHFRVSSSDSRRVSSFESHELPARVSVTAGAVAEPAAASRKAQAARSAASSRTATGWREAANQHSPDYETLYQLNYLPALPYASLPLAFQPARTRVSGHVLPIQAHGREECLGKSCWRQISWGCLPAFYGARSRLKAAIEQAGNLVDLSGVRRELRDERPAIAALEMQITFDEPGSRNLSNGWLVRVTIKLEGNPAELVGKPGWRTCVDGWTYKSPTAPGLPPIFIMFVSA